MAMAPHFLSAEKTVIAAFYRDARFEAFYGGQATARPMVFDEIREPNFGRKLAMIGASGIGV